MKTAPRSRRVRVVELGVRPCKGTVSRSEAKARDEQMQQAAADLINQQQRRNRP